MEVSIKGYIKSKKSELFYDCADRYAYDKLQNKFTISDGVSKSFFPKIWADVLAHNWVRQQWVSNDEFIKYCQKEWLEQVTEVANKPDAKWFTKNAFNRKEVGLATFVGLQFYEIKKKWFWKAIALGDSFMFYLPKETLDFSKDCVVLSSKQNESIAFDNFPDYLSSIGDKHKGKPGQKKGVKLSEGTFYLMTDALAEWFLNEKENAINKINVWQNQKDFERFVDEERNNEKLGNDDSAILIIKIEKDKKDQLSYVLEDVSDIHKLVKVQQKEIEVSEKAKEQELILQKENSNAEITTEQTQQTKPVENNLSEEVETEIEKSKKGLFEKGKEWILGKKENEQSAEQEEIDEKVEVEVAEEHQEEKEPSTQEKENHIELEKSEDSEKNESKESESKSKEEPESNTKAPNKPTQDTINKF
jgi:hypothetical protein